MCTTLQTPPCSTQVACRVLGLTMTTCVQAVIMRIRLPDGSWRQLGDELRARSRLLADLASQDYDEATLPQQTDVAALDLLIADPEPAQVSPQDAIRMVTLCYLLHCEPAVWVRRAADAIPYEPSGNAAVEVASNDAAEQSAGEHSLLTLLSSAYADVIAASHPVCLWPLSFQHKLQLLPQCVHQYVPFEVFQHTTMKLHSTASSFAKLISALAAVRHKCSDSKPISLGSVSCQRLQDKSPDAVRLVDMYAEDAAQALPMLPNVRMLALVGMTAAAVSAALVALPPESCAQTAQSASPTADDCKQQLTLTIERESPEPWPLQHAGAAVLKAAQLRTLSALVLDFHADMRTWLALPTTLAALTALTALWMCGCVSSCEGELFAEDPSRPMKWYVAGPVVSCVRAIGTLPRLQRLRLDASEHWISMHPEVAFGDQPAWPGFSSLTLLQLHNRDVRQHRRVFGRRLEREVASLVQLQYLDAHDVPNDRGEPDWQLSQITELTSIRLVRRCVLLSVIHMLSIMP